MPAPRPYRGSAAEWDAFIERQRGWSHFHRFGWRDLIESTFGHRSHYLEVREGDELSGVLPLFEVKSRLFGHYLVSMPFLNYGGPLGSPDAVASLVRAAVAVADAQDVDLLELRSGIELDVGLPVSHRKVTVVLPLPRDPEVLWEDLKSKVRSQVRRPMKEDVEVRFGPGEWEPFYDVYSRHMRHLGTPALPPEWFAGLTNTFGDSCWFGVAYLANEPVAAGCGFRWGTEFEITWASSLREHNRIAPNMLLYWEFIARAAREGIERFNFGRCTPGSGTHRFKRQWGGEDEALWWYHQANARRGSTPSPDDGIYAWGPRVWRHLPLGLTRWLGSRIVRSIP